MSDQEHVEQADIEIGNYKIIDLKPVEQKQDGSESLFKARSKVYFWDKESKEWKERGIGNVSIVKDQETQKIKVVHVQEQTFKIRVLFYVYGEKLCQLKKMETGKNSY